MPPKKKNPKNIKQSTQPVLGTGCIYISHIVLSSSCNTVLESHHPHESEPTKAVHFQPIDPGV